LLFYLFSDFSTIIYLSTMAPAKLETENHSRDAAFNKAMHQGSSAAAGGFSAMLKKDKAAQKAAVDEYFKHWDDKAAKDETDADREVSFPTKTPKVIPDARN
jgi:hypothetical protein